jgi:DNA-nicking Smr family endonuclease
MGTPHRPDPADSEVPSGAPGDEDQPVVLPIEETLDLHTFAPREIPDLVRDYLEACACRGFREVRIIHGRGTGTQRATVRSILAGHPLVQIFADAPPERGGWGATVVRLREGPGAARHGQ